MFYDSFNATSYKSGKIKIEIPKVDGSGYDYVNGLLAGDIAINLGVEWGPILPDAEILQKANALMGSNNIVSWLQSSAVAWKGTKPLEFKADFYLLSLYEGQNIKAEAKKLAVLSTMYVDESNRVTGKVHGGYSVDYAMSNNVVDYFSSSDTVQSMLTDIRDAKGTINVYIGSEIKIGHLLLESITLTPSSVLVRSGQPLFIKIEANFRSNRSPLSGDLDSIFGGTTVTATGNPSPSEIEVPNKTTSPLAGRTDLVIKNPDNPSLPLASRKDLIIKNPD